MVVVLVEGYDCCSMTDSIWINHDLPKGTKVNLGDFDNDRNSEKLRKELKKNGFKMLKVQTISYGGNY